MKHSRPSARPKLFCQPSCLFLSITLLHFHMHSYLWSSQREQNLLMTETPPRFDVSDKSQPLKQSAVWMCCCGGYPQINASGLHSSSMNFIGSYSGSRTGAAVWLCPHLKGLFTPRLLSCHQLFCHWKLESSVTFMSLLLDSMNLICYLICSGWIFNIN